ncbi:unnamed protein product [Symbiodinium sp. KB8]|nr:unnamed protein product [Symbiodinium sp. KB8]
MAGALFGVFCGLGYKQPLSDAESPYGLLDDIRFLSSFGLGVGICCWADSGKALSPQQCIASQIGFML